MDSVPPEIARLIAESFDINSPNELDWPFPTVSDPDEATSLAALCQTSKAIHEISVPALYHTVSLMSPLDDTEETFRHDRFLRTITMNPSLAKYVTRIAMRTFESLGLQGTDRCIHELIKSDQVPESTKVRCVAHLLSSNRIERDGAIYLLHLLDNLELLDLKIPNSFAALNAFEMSLEPQVCLDSGGNPLGKLKELRLRNCSGLRNACQLWRLISNPSIKKVRLFGFAWANTTVPGFTFNMQTCDVPFLDIQAGNISPPELSEIFDRFVKLRHLTIEFDHMLAPLTNKSELGAVLREKGRDLEHLSLDMVRQNQEAGINGMLRGHWSFTFGSFGSLTTLNHLKHLRLNRRDLLGINGENPQRVDESSPSSLSQALPTSLETLFLYTHERFGTGLIMGLKYEKGHVDECYDLMRSPSFSCLREIKFELRARPKFKIIRSRVTGWTVTVAKEMVSRNVGVDEDEPWPYHYVITMTKN